LAIGRLLNVTDFGGVAYHGFRWWVLGYGAELRRAAGGVKEVGRRVETGRVIVKSCARFEVMIPR
jgi:hypothetical protein